MDLPIEIKSHIENELNNISKKELQYNAETISLNYRNNEGQGKRMLKSKQEAIAYAISRMPATFGAVYNSLKHTLEICKADINTLADIGAGTGTASIAANELLELEKIECFEREEAMRAIGQKIFNSYNELGIKTNWKKYDVNTDKINDKYDLVITSYMINEIEETNIEVVIDKLWDTTNKILLIVEPGTMQGYRNIMRAKQRIRERGGKIIAPCMSEKCKLPKDDWCNFSCRVQRTKIHKELKGGNVPYEDEKYIYISATKEEFDKKEKNRILRHPMIYSGYVKLKVCNKEEIKEIIISKKDKEKFKIARKADTGDLI